MSPSEWLKCEDPQRMLDALKAAGRLTERKARLFSVACCRRIWALLPDERCRNAVEVAERYADGLATRDDLVKAHFEASDAAYEPHDDEGTFAYAALAAVNAEPDYAAGETVAMLGRIEQAKLVRDIFNSPAGPGQPLTRPGSPGTTGPWSTWHVASIMSGRCRRGYLTTN